MNKKKYKIMDLRLSKKEKKDVLEYKNKIKKTNTKFVKMIKNPPIKKIDILINEKNKNKNKKINKSITKINNNKSIPELFIKLETENEESYKIRKKFIEHNLPKTKEEYKIIVSLSIILVNKIFYHVKYSDSIENILKDKMKNLNQSYF